MAQSVSTLSVTRYFTEDGIDPYQPLNWVKRQSKIVNPATDKVVFEQADVEFPDFWSQNAVNIVAQKYFYGTPGTPGREFSLKQLIDRVVNTITRHGYQNGYFLDEAEADVFNAELKYILATQRAAFNSPVWFNIGAPDRSQQASACFILKVEDNLPSILNWYREEGMIFKGGSGAGLNISALRGSHELLSSSGGRASGPVSFMRGADASAGTIQSGGKTRRAAKMVILNVDHPDIEEFIWCKAREERKARVLEAAGFEMGLNGRDIISIQYQNANNSVRVNDDFMRAVEADEDWNLVGVKDKKIHKTLPARQLFKQIAEAAWECADPGVQFDTVINDWHTTPKAGRINASNPCSEYMHLDNSACNLASLNLLKFLKDDGSLDVDAYKHVVETVFLAQEILVGYSEYPTENIEKNARAYRELGMGYANLGALLMAKGLPYDSDEGRAVAATLTALMTGHAYATSAKIAKRVGPFAGYAKDEEGMNRILKKHRDALQDIDAGLVPEELLSAAAGAWDEAVELGAKYGVRNSQATVLAPTGTIGFMMDCDTTGVEPDFSLAKFKTLVGGGSMVIVNQTIPRALKVLGYTKDQAHAIASYIHDKGTVVGAPHLKPEDTNVFSCAVGDNAIHYMGHVKMMAAVQPFISGAISKTVNMPESVSVEDVEQIYLDSWKMGIKAIAIYRDNCKVGQPLESRQKQSKDQVAAEAGTLTKAAPAIVVKGAAVRREMPRRRLSKTFSFRVGDLHGYFTVGEYDDGSPGELFVTAAKMGSTLAGLMDSFARSISYGLQYGVPLKAYVKAMSGTSFAPAGATDDPDIKTATSLVDYIFRRLALEYLSIDDRLELGLASLEELEQSLQTQQASLLEDAAAQAASGPAKSDKQPSVADNSAPVDQQPGAAANYISANAPLCSNCGNLTQRAGSCFICTSCGTTSGCS
ncbi:MAG: vitamin B12-dependent ribonucleotide reductase [Candidatus Chaera renei]|uniref:Vitamin B12-dependent ribonucleotide reductase n=1 Tax=Candidatus Chaera renei TaxID=2506947 RepID=A0A4V1J7Q7_9BACT|nr:MAG: vitamin B12-dependent ribonucleotide reductase [Candidatus Chaera renei]